MADEGTGMDKADMKKMLTLSKKQPVNCAVGLTKTGVVLLMDKIKQPKAVLKDLEKKFADMKQPHWGSAVVDMEADPKLVVLTLNKAAPGMARKMRKTLKGTGFSKVEIRLEDGSVADRCDEEEADEEGAPVAGARPQAPTEDAASSNAPAANGGEQAASGGLDAATLTQQLTGLVGQIKAALVSDPSRADQLKSLATQAQVSLKAGALVAAQWTIAELREALGENGDAQQASGSPAPNREALAKAKLAWSATRTKVNDDLQKLHGELAKHYNTHGFGDEVKKVFAAKVQPVIGKLDDSLSEKLDEVAGNADATQHSKLVGEAKQILQQYNAYLTQEPIIAKLDSNPFLPVTIQKTLSATLSTLDRVVT